VLHLRKELSSFHLKGVVLNYGMYDLTFSHPLIVNANDAFIVTQQALESTTDAFVLSTTLESRRDPRISPFYADLQTLGPLPRALFICGTEDILIDDSIFFATRWMIVNNNTKFQVFPGAFHGFVDFAGMPFAKEGWDCITTFLKGNISGA
jgi:acetyl esterase/lipase